MIANDQELNTSLKRIAFFQQTLAQMRVAADPRNFPLMAGGFSSEIEKMHREVMEYLTRHASQPVPTEAADKESGSPALAS